MLTLFCGAANVCNDESKINGKAMKSIEVKRFNATLRYFEFEGSGRPLIMIHGLGCASSFEYPQVAKAPALANRHTILLDLFGSGYSDRPKDFGYYVSDHAQAVADFVEALSFESVDLYGHSMGGTIAIETADKLGEMVENLVLSEANLDSGGGEFSTAIAAAAEADYVQTLHADTIASAKETGNSEWAKTMETSDPVAVYRGAVSLVEGGSTNWRQQFYEHPANKTFIFGAHSLPDPDYENLPAVDVGVGIVPNAGHSMGLENPTGLADCIAEGTRNK